MAERLLSIILIYLLHSPTQALLPPKLMVNKQLIAETDSVRVDCQAPSYLPVFRCYFVIVDTKSISEISCMTSVTGRELLRRSQQTAPAVVQVECFYTLKYGDVNSPSPHSNIFSITIQGSKSRSSTLTPPTSAPNVPAALTPRLPTRTQTQGKRSGSPNPASNWSTAGWTLAPTDGFLTSSLKPAGDASEERDEKTKDEGVLQTTSRSAASTFGTPASGSKSRPSALTPPTSAPNVPAALTPRLPTRTQTQGKRSGSPNPASNWSTDRWVVKVFIALASFGVIVGVVLLGLALRRTVSERTRRSEHQNIEDEYCLYSNITYEVAPSFKENILYSTVEAHEISQQETYYKTEIELLL